MYSLVAWLLVLIVTLTIEGDTKDFKQEPTRSVTYFTLTFPLYLIVLFGCYSLISIGYHMIVLEDCEDAQNEVLRQVQEAKSYLGNQGMKFD